MFRIVTMCYGAETPPPPPLLRSEFCPMTTPKLASNVLDIRLLGNFQ